MSNSLISKYYRDEEDESSCESLYFWLVSPFDFTQDKLCEGSLLRIVRDSYLPVCGARVAPPERHEYKFHTDCKYPKLLPSTITCNHDKTLTLPLSSPKEVPNGRGEATLTKCHLNPGEVVFEIKEQLELNNIPCVWKNKRTGFEPVSDNLSAFAFYFILYLPQPFNFNRYFIPIFQLSHAGRCTGKDQVTRLKRHHR